MRTALVISLAAVALLGAGCGRPILFAEIEEQSICKTVREAPFAGVMPGTDLQTELPFPLGDYLPLFQVEGATLTLQLVELVFTARTGISDFNAVEQGTVTVLAPVGSSEVPVVPAAYARDTNPPGSTLVMAAQTAMDLAPYLDAESNLTLQTWMTGALPESDWTADIKGCIYMKARLNYATGYGL